MPLLENMYKTTNLCEICLDSVAFSQKIYLLQRILKSWSGA